MNSWVGADPISSGSPSQITTSPRRPGLSEPLAELIEQCLAQDPRPAYQTPTPERRYGVRLWDVEVHWHYPTATSIQVLDVTAAV